MRRFVEANAPKIRRKVREARDPETQRDLRAELLAAARLLADRRFDIVYEAAGAGTGGPDFAVIFRASVRFNLEVTRRRGAAEPAAIAEALVAKLRQLPPSTPNVLVVALDGPLDADEINAAVVALRGRADARDAVTLARAGAADPKSFYDRFLRLAGILAWSESAAPGARAASWANPSARIPLERSAIDAVRAALAAD